MAAGVEAVAEVAVTEIKMEEESGAAGVPSSNGAPGPKGEGERPAQNEKRKEKNMKRGGNHFEPYANPTKRYRAFITNIPFDVKWQSLKDLVKEKLCCDSHLAQGVWQGCDLVIVSKKLLRACCLPLQSGECHGTLSESHIKVQRVRAG
uniref:HnRNP M nuclear localisation signal domain-containing protein n=1 Tax=Aotus nancymaae TaxID=37293 RepID=A0A2K5C3R8_AOTNA